MTTGRERIYASSASAMTVDDWAKAWAKEWQRANRLSEALQEVCDTLAVKGLPYQIAHAALEAERG